MLVPLFCSCHLFLANAMYACYLKNWVVFELMFVSYVFSALHYLTYTEESMYHYLDVYASRSAVGFLIPYSTKYVHYVYSAMALNNIVLSYGMSRCVYWLDPEKLTWIWFHIYFHMSTSFCVFVFLKNYQSWVECGMSLRCRNEIETVKKTLLYNKRE